MPSLRARLVDSVALPLRRGTRAWSAEAVHASLTAPPAPATARAPAGAAPRWLGRVARHSVTTWAGWPVHELAPAGRDSRAPAGGPGAEVTVLYLHGGGYLHEMLRWHWYLLARLTRAVPARFVVPVYPLAPRGTAADVVPVVADLLADLVAAARADPSAQADSAQAEPGAAQAKPGAAPAEPAATARVVLMGDSAGGGLALAAAQLTRDRAATQPDGIVLISPWLDVTMSDPTQPALAPKDRILAVPGLAAAGVSWAGALGPAHPLASPLHGDLAGVAPLTVLCGTHDVLLPDSRRLAARAAAAGVEIDYQETRGLPHGYPLFPIPEAAAARDVIAAALRGPRPHG